jgi:GxxExxY protein
MENNISREIIASAMELQRELGIGLLESAYMAALCVELARRRVNFAQEVGVCGQYKGVPLGLAYRADLIVQQRVIVEVKAVEAISDLHRSQLLSYLRLSGLKLGLLINFHSAPLFKGVHRVVNGL